MGRNWLTGIPARLLRKFSLLGMTYGIKTVTGVVTATNRRGFFGTVDPLFGADWKQIKLGGDWSVDDLWTYAFGAHIGHLTEFCVALTCWQVIFADREWEAECREWRWGWVSTVLLFNLGCEVVFVGFWHWLVYVSRFMQGLAPYKFNPVNQYDTSIPTNQPGQLK